VQTVHTAPVPADGEPRHYLLAGLVFCGICGRLMDSHWVHDRPSYLREDHLLERIRATASYVDSFPGWVVTTRMRLPSICGLGA